MALLAGLGVVLGGVGGGAALVIVRLVGLISNVALLGHVGAGLPDLAHYHPSLLLVPVALGGAVIVILLARWSPIIKGHGIPESLEAIVLRESRISPRAAVAKPLSAAVAMGTGGPFGAEGPIIVTGGAVGSLLGQILPVSSGERRILLATGAAAGMAGVFNTPLAAIILAFELLVFERSLRALLPLVIATGIAAEIHTLTLGTQPLFAVASDPRIPVGQLPFFVVLGLLAGVLAVVLNKGLFACEAVFRRLPVAASLNPLIGAAAFAGIGLAVPGSLSVGYWAIGDAVNGRFLLGTAAMLCAAKAASWWVALASDTSGGTLAPMFLIGATMGEMVGIGTAHLLPADHVDAGAFAVVAMGATFAAGSRALFTGGVFALEVTGAYHLAIPMLLALGAAELVAEQFLRERIMTDKLARRGLAVDLDVPSDTLGSRPLCQVMDPLPASGPDPGAPAFEGTTEVPAALALFATGKATSVTVMEGETPVGILTPATLAARLLDQATLSDPQPPTLHLRRPPGLARHLGAWLARLRPSGALDRLRRHHRAQLIRRVFRLGHLGHPNRPSPDTLDPPAKEVGLGPVGRVGGETAAGSSPDHL